MHMRMDVRASPATCVAGTQSNTLAIRAPPPHRLVTLEQVGTSLCAAALALAVLLVVRADGLGGQHACRARAGRRTRPS
eukprot:356747-Chlamydomonas_euryale.AAC.2